MRAVTTNGSHATSPPPAHPPAHHSSPCPEPPSPPQWSHLRVTLFRFQFQTAVSRRQHKALVDSLACMRCFRASMGHSKAVVMGALNCVRHQPPLPTPDTPLSLLPALLFPYNFWHGSNKTQVRGATLDPGAHAKAVYRRGVDEGVARPSWGVVRVFDMSVPPPPHPHPYPYPYPKHGNIHAVPIPVCHCQQRPLLK